MTLRTRLKEADGFGVIELLVAITIISIAILGLATALSNSQTSLTGTGQVATATALANQQMEGYRALPYASISLDTNYGATLDTTYKTDAAYTSTNNISNPSATDCQAAGANGLCLCSTTCPTTQNPQATPIQQTITAPDNHQYRIDSYIFTQTPTAAGLTGRPLKTITIVIRDSKTPTHTYARLQTTLDQATN